MKHAAFVSVVLCGLLSCCGAEPTAAELVRRAKNRPSLLCTAARLPEVKARLAVDADAKKWLDRLRKEEEKRLAAGVTAPDSVAQWAHWYSCRKCGTHLKGERPTRHVCPKCGEAHTGWPYDEAYLFPVHNELGEEIRDCGLLWRLTDERRYLARARTLLLAYAAKYDGYAYHSAQGPLDSKKTGGAKIFPQALDEAVWLVKAMQGYDAVADALAADERTAIEERLIRPAAALIKRENCGIHNHECWHLSAYGLAGLVLGDAAWVEAAMHSKTGYHEQLAKGLFDDGCWFEGAWGYHFYTIRSLMPIFVALDNLGCPPPDRFRLMLESPFGQVTPTWQLPAMNDTGRMRFAPGAEADFYEYAYAWWGNPAFGWWVSRNPRTTRAYVLAGRPVPPDVSFPAPASRVYADSGVAVLRSAPGNYIAVDYGPHGGWHGHFDKLNLLLWGRGEMLAEDPGCIAYGNPRHFGWYKNTLSHNTVALDGVHQRPATGTLVVFTATNDWTLCAVRADGIAPDAQVGRATALVGDVVLDFIWVKSARARQIDWAFHSRGAFDCDVSRTPERLPEPKGVWRGKRPVETDGSDTLAWMTDVARGAHAGLWHAAWKTGRTTLNLWQKSPAGELWTGEGDAQPPPQRFRVAVNRVNAAGAGFPTVMTLDGTTQVSFGEDVADPDGTIGFTAQVGARRFVLLVNPDGTSCRGKPGKAVVQEISR